MSDPPNLNPEPSPIGAQPLAYRTPFDEPRRPGILTAVGIVSICVACLGLLAGAYGLFETTIVSLPSTSYVSSMTVVSSGSGATTVTTTTTSPTMSFAPPFTTRTLILSFISEGLNTIAALYLLVIGILVLRNVRRGRALHLIYAKLKLLLVLLSIWAYWWWMTDMLNNSVLAGKPPPLSTLILIYSTIYIVPGCLYPIALLVVMNVKSVKAYYSTATHS